MFRHANWIYLVGFISHIASYWSWSVHIMHIPWKKHSFFQTSPRVAIPFRVFQEKISTSLDKLKSWRDFVMAKVQKKQMSMPHFYKLNVIIRNLQHEKAAQARKRAGTCHECCDMLWQCESMRNIHENSWISMWMCIPGWELVEIQYVACKRWSVNHKKNWDAHDMEAGIFAPYVTRWRMPLTRSMRKVMRCSAISPFCPSIWKTTTWHRTLQWCPVSSS